MQEVTRSGKHKGGVQGIVGDVVDKTSLDSTPSDLMQVTGGESKSKVLVVTGDNNRKQMMEKVLVNKVGFDVVVESNGSDGLERFRGDSDIGVVVTDDEMPEGMNGTEMAGGVKGIAKERGRKVGILVLSKDDPNRWEELLNDNNFDMVMNWESFDLANFIHVVRQLMNDRETV